MFYGKRTAFREGAVPCCVKRARTQPLRNSARQYAYKIASSYQKAGKACFFMKKDNLEQYIQQ